MYEERSRMGMYVVLVVYGCTYAVCVYVGRYVR